MFLVAVYVDNIIVGGKSDVIMSAVKKEPSYKFEIKDLRPLHYFLGVKVIQIGESGVGQPVYTEKVLQRYGMQTCQHTCQSRCQACCLREDRWRA